MTDGEYVLSGSQHEAMMKAVAAITRQLKVMVGEPQPHLPSLWVIGTNLTIIQDALSNPRQPCPN
jgi:hypothetical protein